jgi:hypothetical protein
VRLNTPNGTATRPSILAAAPDGSGGWYIGGDFTSVNGVGRFYAARIDASGNVLPWVNNNLDGVVHEIVTDGSGNVFLGGAFTGRIMKTDATTGTQDGTWTASVTSGSAVYAMAITGTTLYIGGSFTVVGGGTGGGSRTQGASVSTTGSGTWTTWNASATGGGSTIRSLVVSGTTVYIGGSFSTVKATARTNAAAINTTGAGTLQTWAPTTNGTVYSIKISGAVAYLGGVFTSPMGRLVAWSSAPGAVGTLQNGAWSVPNDSVYALEILGSTLYAHGRFTQVGGTTRTGLASYDTGTGALTSWSPGTTGALVADATLAVSGNKVFVGGYAAFGGIPRTNAVAINSDGSLSSWDPAPNGAVESIAVNGSTVYLGGTFSSAGGSSRTNAAAVDPSTGTATSWDPAPNSTVYHLALSGSTVYLGGAFTSLGGSTRNRAGSVGTDGTLTSWDPNANGAVRAITVDGSTVYLGGAFTTIGGTSRVGLAAVDSSAGTAQAFNASLTASSVVYTTLLDGSTLYFGGTVIASAGGQARNRIAAVDVTTSLATSWNPGTGATNVTKLARRGQVIYAVGTWSSNFGGQSPRFGLAAVDDSTGLANTWAGSAMSASTTIDTVATGVDGSIMVGSSEGVASHGTPPGTTLITAPVNTVLPVLSGTATQGQVLTMTTGTWTQSPDVYTYQWQQCDAAGANCTDILGAENAAYTLQAGDATKTVRGLVTAANLQAVGVTASSAASSVIT